jgi:membrane-associated phospholipid phosphatase
MSNNKYHHKIKNVLSFIDDKDKHLSDFIHSLELRKEIEYGIYCFARLFNPDLVLFYFTIILLNSVLKNNDYFFVFKPFAHTFIGLVITTFMKRATNRPRPILKENKKRIKNLRAHEKNCSMPSGDSLQAANFAIIIYFYFNSYLGFFLIPFVMFARIFYFCHYITDTIVGTFLGLFISRYVYYLLN